MSADRAAAPWAADPAPHGLRAPLLRRSAEVAAGIAAPLASILLLSWTDDPTIWRPGAVLLGVVVAVAVVLGRLAGWVATAVSAIGVWGLTGGPWSWGVEDAPEAVSLVVYAVTAVGVMLLVTRHESSRRRADLQERTTRQLLDQTPVGIALFDRNLRFRWVNRELADLDGVPAEGHLGRRPRDLNPVAGPLYEHLLEEVRDTRAAITDRLLSVRPPDSPTERHWRASYFPVLDPDDRLLGIGSTVDEVTGDVVARRRSELLLDLAQRYASVTDVDQLGVSLSSFLAAAFGARAAVAVPDADPGKLRVLASLEGYRAEEAAAWGTAVFSLDEIRPLTDAARSRSIVALADGYEFDLRYPHLAASRAASGDQSIVCVPVVDAARSEVLAVFRLAWPHARRLTDTSRTLCGTVASLTALALNRIRLATERDRDRFRSALDAMLDHVTIGEAVRDADGRLLDFRITYMNEHSLDGAGRMPSELVGRRVLEMYPGWDVSGMFEKFVSVVQSGEPFVEERLRYEDELPDGRAIEGYWSLQVSRLGDGFIAASREVTDVVHLEQAQRIAELAAEREATSIELLQRAALPVDLPRIEALTVGADYRPASEQPVGGDWFDAFRLDDGTIAVVIADVAGHGTDSAAAMVQVRNILRAMAVEHRDPSEVLARADAVTATLSDPDGPFITCCYGLVDMREGTFSWALAGHLPPLLVRGGETRYLDAPRNPPLAIGAGAGFGSASVRTQPGDRLVLCTDGLVERRGEVIDVGLDRLRADVVELSGLDAQAAAEALGATVLLPLDDLAVLVLDIGDRPRPDPDGSCGD